MTPTAPTFIDFWPTHNGPHTYTVTNEEPETFDRILGNRAFKRVAAICSAGEVLLEALLPRSEAVVAVDHSYGSLAITYLKTILLQQYTQKDLLALSEISFKEAVEHATQWLPDPLRNSRGPNDMLSSHYDLRREWKFLSKLDIAAKRVQNLTLIHADLSDLPSLQGTFELFYASNAMEHISRFNRSPGFSEFYELLDEDGLLLYSRTYITPASAGYFKDLKASPQARSSWYHVLSQKVKRNACSTDQTTTSVAGPSQSSYSWSSSPSQA